jgi:hypothetical protein
MFPEDAVTRPTFVEVSAPASAPKSKLTLVAARGKDAPAASEPPPEPAEDKPSASLTKMTPRVKRLPPGFKLSTSAVPATKARTVSDPEAGKLSAPPSPDKQLKAESDNP